jgi:hypothetical protein
MAAGFVGFAQNAEEMSLERFARTFVSELADIKNGLDESAERVYKDVYALHRRHGTQLMQVVSEHIGKYQEQIAHGALPDDCLLDMIANKQHLRAKEILEREEVETATTIRVKPEKSSSAKKPVASKFTKWRTPGDACFIIDGARTKFHLNETAKDLCLKSNSRAETLLRLLIDRCLTKDEVKKSICTPETKPYEAVRDINRLLNTKVKRLGFQAVPADTEFIGCDDRTGQYFCHLPIKTQDEWERD